MVMTEQEFSRAEAEGVAVRQLRHAVAARYDRKSERLVISLHNDVELAVPVRLIEGLSGVDPKTLVDVEITPSGLGLHWPALDADVYVPALLSGVFGSRSWMASSLGAKGGRVSSPAKAAASQNNGRKGGRPRKQNAAP